MISDRHGTHTDRRGRDRAPAASHVRCDARVNDDNAFSLAKTIMTWHRQSAEALFVRVDESEPWTLVLNTRAGPRARAHAEAMGVDEDACFVIAKTCEVGDDPLRDVWDDEECPIDSVTAARGVAPLMALLKKTHYGRGRLHVTYTDN